MVKQDSARPVGSMLMQCGSCGADIYFIRTKKNAKPIPVNVEPVFFKPCTASFVTPTGAVVRGIEVERSDPEARTGFVTHFASCPDADKHRRGE